MVFSSTLFLFIFLPTVIICYFGLNYIFANRLRNLVLLVFSYIFYLFGAADFLLILMGSTIADFFIAHAIHKSKTHKKLWLICSIVLNIGLLFWFKYANFMAEQLSPLISYTGFSTQNWSRIILPVGISFFTFQKLSYTIDLYKGKLRPITNFIDYAMYAAMFPQISAGPIVRFTEIRDQVMERVETWDLFYGGAFRFCWGLCKKVMIADACGRIANSIFNLSPQLLETKTAWLGAFAYTLQIYFDFSAYSDMAIGLGMMLGFRFPENFNRPYSAISLTDFWRRWHMSLSRWFRDYLYLPLGGNRKGKGRTYLNLILVFLLCGLWHGANWTFIFWGAYHGVFLIAERLTGVRDMDAAKFPVLRRGVTLLLVMFGWVFFKSQTIGHAFSYIAAMFSFNDLPIPEVVGEILNLKNMVFFLIAAASVFLPERSGELELKLLKSRPVSYMAAIILFIILLPYCVAIIAGSPETPFIYYRF